MQQKMKDFGMGKADMEALLSRAEVGRISTISGEGFPYTVAVNFIYEGGAIYFHCLPKGEKLDNIARCPKVCFEVDEMKGLRLQKAEGPCSVGTSYESVVALGRAEGVDSAEEKRKILEAIVAKYAPKFRGLAIPQSKVQGTAVVKISVDRMTGKCRK